MQDSNIGDNLLPVPSIGVGGIIFNDRGQVLLIRRNQPPASGFWSIPGGKLEPGESLAEACKREINEETGLDVEATAIVAVVERRIEGYHYVIIDYLALLTNDQVTVPIAQSDAAEAKWVSLGQIPDYALVEGLEEIIVRTYVLYTKQRVGGLHDVNATGKDYILQV